MQTVVKMSVIGNRFLVVGEWDFMNWRCWGAGGASVASRANSLREHARPEDSYGSRGRSPHHRVITTYPCFESSPYGGALPRRRYDLLLRAILVFFVEAGVAAA